MSESNPGCSRDRLDRGIVLIGAVLFSCLIALVFLAIDSALGKPRAINMDRIVFAGLRLSAPILAPSGGESRNPERPDVRIDRRLSPFIDLPDPETGTLLIRGRLP
jgi:hypothetical protein